MSIAFDNGAEKLLWVPPAIPYYELRGVFKVKKEFSKVLVFSAWEMVPRMIACTLSYKCERCTTGKLYAKEDDKRNKGYLSDARTRYPYRKLTENRIKPLTTASWMLAEIYNPVEHMGKPLREDRKFVSHQQTRKIVSLVKEAKGYEYHSNSRTKIIPIEGIETRYVKNGSIHRILFPEPLNRRQVHKFTFEEVLEDQDKKEPEANEDFGGQSFETPTLNYRQKVILKGDQPGGKTSYKKSIGKRD